MNKLIIFPIKRKFLDRIFMQIGHFLVKFKLQHHIPTYLDDYPMNLDFLRHFLFVTKNTPTPKNLRASHAYTIFSNYSLFGALNVSF